MRNLTLGVMVLVAAGGSAIAADPIVYVPPTPPVLGHFTHQSEPFDWSGLYLGGYVAHVSGALTGAATDPAISQIDGGAQLHYNVPVGNNWILSPFLIVPVPGAITETEFTVDWAAIGGLRLGYAHGRWLPYAFLGGEVAGVTATGVATGTNTHTGVVAGAGFEYALHDRWTVGARYAYVSMGAQDYAVGGSVGWQGHSIAATLNFRLH
jgi:opacity protein-like surface antigen